MERETSFCFGLLGKESGWSLLACLIYDSKENDNVCLSCIGETLAWLQLNFSLHIILSL